MSFLAAPRLWLLAVPVALAALYVVLQMRRTAYAVRFTNVELLDRVAPDRPGWRRHLPALLLVLALATLVVAFARPARSVEVTRPQATLVLTVDVSLSMGAEDVAPSRLAAAQEAARSFLDLAPAEMRIGLVAFDGTARGVAPPSVDRAVLARAIDSLELGPATAIGEGIFAALGMLETDAAVSQGEGGGEAPDEGAPAEETPDEPAAGVIVLSDGTTTEGRPDAVAAAAAADAGIPVYTVAFGTERGVVTVDGELVPVPVDEGALAGTAESTGGRFFTADSAAELGSIFDEVGTEVGVGTEDREISDWFAGLGLLLGALAAAGSLAWFSRLP